MSSLQDRAMPSGDGFEGASIPKDTTVVKPQRMGRGNAEVEPLPSGGTGEFGRMRPGKPVRHCRIRCGEHCQFGGPYRAGLDVWAIIREASVAIAEGGGHFVQVAYTVKWIFFQPAGSEHA